MEQLSIAYVRAVAAQAGWKFCEIEPDTDSVDGILMSDIGSCPRIEFQLKSTARDIMRDDGLHFPLPIKNYKDLRKETDVPRILIVMWMPKNEADRLNQTRNELCMRHCCYWVSLEGMPEKQNKTSVTVFVPVGNVFDAAQLNNMTNLIDQEGE